MKRDKWRWALLRCTVGVYLDRIDYTTREVVWSMMTNRKGGAHEPTIKGEPK